MNEEISNALLKWWQENKRDLPWRKNKNPYFIWVSEIMLQQTKAQTVIPYFERFIKEIPTIEELSSANEDKLLKLWEGLGYYNRVLHMQKCAKVLKENGKSTLPSSYKELLSLPGIGPYTAGAIASIAYNQKVCAVDGNVLRVTSRIFNSFDDISNPKVRKKVEEKLNKKMPKESGDFNQCLMDFGAMICIPSLPRCNICPIATYCMGYKHKNMYKLPIKKKKAKQKEENVTVFLLTYKKKIAICKRPKKGLLSSLFEFPNKMNSIDEKELSTLFSIKNIKKLPSHKHVFSHRIWHMEGYHLELLEKPKEDYIWVTFASLKKNYSIPSAFLPFLNVLEKDLNP